MNFFDFALGNFGGLARSGGIRYGITPTGSDVVINDRGEGLTVLYTCIKILSDNFSRIPITVRDKDNKIIAGHPVANLWNIQSSTWMNPQTVRSTGENDRNIYGNSFFEIKNSELIYIQASEINDWKVENNKLLYKFTPISNPRIKIVRPAGWIDSTKLLHFRGVSSDGVFGISPLQACHGTHQLMQNAVKTVSSFYKNNAMSTNAVETTTGGNTKYSEILADRKLFKDQYAGVENAGGTIRLSLGEKIIPLAVKFADTELIGTMEFSRDTITSAYQIPNFMLSSNDSSQGIEEQTKSFVSTTMASIANIYKHELEYKLLPLDERFKGVHITFDLDELVELTFGDLVNGLSVASNNGLITANEAVKKLGGTPITGEVGDSHFRQAQYIPMEDYEKYSPLTKQAPFPDKQLSDNQNINNNDLSL